MNFIDRIKEYTATTDQTDICVYCGKSGCDKIALPDLGYIDHPERRFGPGDMCHAKCEAELRRESDVKF